MQSLAVIKLTHACNICAESRQWHEIIEFTSRYICAAGLTPAFALTQNIYLFKAEGSAVRRGGVHRAVSPVKRRRSAGASEADDPAGGKQSRTSDQDPARPRDSQEPPLPPTPPPPPPGSPPQTSAPERSTDPSADGGTDPDLVEGVAASAAEERHRSTSAAAAAGGGEEERGGFGNAESEPAASRSQDAAGERCVAILRLANNTAGGSLRVHTCLSVYLGCIPRSWQHGFGPSTAKSH